MSGSVFQLEEEVEVFYAGHVDWEVLSVNTNTKYTHNTKPHSPLGIAEMYYANEKTTTKMILSIFIRGMEG